MTRWIQWVEALSTRVGRAVGWLAVAMILIGAFNAVARYSGRFLGANLSSNAWLELQWYLFSAVFLLGASYALASGSHVRVDVLYARFSAKTRAWIDFLGGLLFLLPFVVISLVLTWPPVWRSWQIREGSPDPGGLARYPVKALILVGFAMLLLQGTAEVMKAWRRLRGTESEEDVEEVEVQPVGGDRAG